MNKIEDEVMEDWIKYAHSTIKEAMDESGIDNEDNDNLAYWI
jgi:3-oxoacyl-(acyl-carrier-protein) synthase